MSPPRRFARFSAAAARRCRRFFTALPPGAKLAALFVLSLAAFAGGNLYALGAFAAAAPLLFLLCGFGLRRLWRQMGLYAALAFCLCLILLLSAPPASAAAAGLRLFAVTAGSVFLSAVTASGALLRTLERGLKRLAPLGLEPRQTALALLLTLRFLPLLQESYAALREAQKARGAEKLSWRARAELSGLALARLLSAREALAEAIEARGFTAPQPERKPNER